MIVIAIFVIFFMGYLRSKNDDDFVGAFAVSTYACLVISIPLWIIGFIDGVSFGFVIAGTLISSAVLYMDKRGQ